MGELRIRFRRLGVFDSSTDVRERVNRSNISQATVREDYSGNGDAWTHFPHEHARSRAYRWGEDGIGGISSVGLLEFASNLLATSS